MHFPKTSIADLNDCIDERVVLHAYYNSYVLHIGICKVRLTHKGNEFWCSFLCSVWKWPSITRIVRLQKAATNEYYFSHNSSQLQQRTSKWSIKMPFYDKNNKVTDYFIAATERDQHGQKYQNNRGITWYIHWCFFQALGASKAHFHYRSRKMQNYTRHNLGL